jgi:hypothetical protein
LSLAKEAADGEERVGCLKKDCYNFVDNKKIIMIEVGILKV